MSSALPRPSCSAKPASLISGIRMRLTRKPGQSLLVIVVLPSFCHQRHRHRVGVVAGLQRADDLDELHHRHRVHEVHPDHALGAPVDRREAT
jgi:hypothetical protein